MRPGWQRWIGRTGALLGVAVVLLPLQMRAASFDCAQAVSPMEQAICSDTKLSAADSDMAQAYRQALALMPPEGAAEFRADQRRWLEVLQQGCNIALVATAGADGKPVDAPAGSPEAKANLERIAKCMTGAYADRLSVLKHGFAMVGGVVFVTRSVTLLSPDKSPDGVDAPVSPELATFEGFGTLNASWPEAQSREPKWQAWNAAVLARLQRLAADEEDVKQGPGWHAAMAHGLDGTLQALTPQMANGRVTVAMSEELMGHGAAHPAESYAKFTWLLDEGRPLQAGDVFLPRSAWRTVLAAEAWKDVRGQAMLYDPEHRGGKALRDAVADVSNWTLTPRGLQISWPEYSIAPRAAHPDDAVVPWTALRAVLQPAFVP